MKIAIDARWIYREISGIGAYTQALIEQFACMETGHEFVLLFYERDLMQRTVDELGLATRPSIKTALVPHSIFRPAGQFFLPKWLKANGIDLFHSTNYMIPLFAFPRNRRGRTACVVTIHDMIPMIYREQVAKSRKARMYPLFCWLMRQVISRADAILTVSESSARDIVDYLRVKEARRDKIRVVYNGVDPMFTPSPESGLRFQKRPEDERRLLYVGRADPYKNLGNLLRAFKRARERVASPLRLVIAGAEDPRYPEAGRVCRELGLLDCVSWTGYLTHEELLDYYQRADLLVHPSRYEGFGLQIIEAMACGTPVVCSKAASLPEVAGDAARLLAPDDVEGFASAIVEIVGDTERAKALSQKGLSQAATFSWQKAAKETLDIYETFCRPTER